MSADETFETASVRLFQGLAGRFRTDRLQAEGPSRRPPRLWELDHKHLCPVVGTCLSIEGLHKLARKHGVVPGGATDYEAHVTVVGHCNTRNALSEAMQRTLDRRHALWVDRFAKAGTAEAANRLWKEALAQGEAAGALWGVLTCRAAGEELRQTAYEDIHMLSHQVGAGVRADLRRTAGLEEKVRQLEAEQARARRRADQAIAEGDLMVRHMERRLAEARAQASEADRLRREVEALASGTRLAELEARLAEAEGRAARLERQAERLPVLEGQVAALGAENSHLAEAAGRAEAERGALERLLLADEACSGQCRNCPEGLQGRCVLCVGGRPAALPQYRRLAERLGVRLIHHDGGREEALSRLPELLAASDAVICPTDCVSHAAYYRLKRHCRQLGKPCVLARGSGMASFALALERLAAGRTDIQPEARQEA